MILINLLTWTRGRLGYKGTHRLSVLIPARNEAENIETCISAIAKPAATPRSK
jgi:cellulose synthase/poly-beta-1,6-N-acetylglucosamine synthase-like glycosyltransferase